MEKIYIGYQGDLPVRVESTREIIENDPFLKCDRIVVHSGPAKLLGGKILFGKEIEEYLFDQAYKEFDSKVEQRLNDFAATRRYSNIYTAANYRGNPVQKYDVEGTYCFRMLGETYAKCEELLEEYMPAVIAGERTIPTWEEIEAQLPALVWPEIVEEQETPDEEVPSAEATEQETTDEEEVPPVDLPEQEAADKEIPEQETQEEV